MPEWRNGRRAGLKIPWGQLRGGSSPPSGTNQIKMLHAPTVLDLERRFAHGRKGWCRLGPNQLGGVGIEVLLR
jgi:hypothetical protein